jgi:L-2-hydroxyglutarate oxidase
MARYVVVGAGIVGLATAYEIVRSRPEAQVTVLDKEDRVAAHQTGHNSGVIHAGVYYKPGSLKAELCRAGRQSMMEFCDEHGIPVDHLGKLIVATDDSQVDRLNALHERASANGLDVQLITSAEATEIEPHLACTAAMRVPATAVTDYTAVTRKLAALIEAAGGRIELGTRVLGVRTGESTTQVVASTGDLTADVFVNCAGLHADRVARLAGIEPRAKIVPFRGEYYELRPDKRDLVRGLIYPVPDPRFPFLGVHLTRMIDGSVHCGPNAVLALAREGYRWRDVSPRDVLDTATYPGMWRLGARHARTGIAEVARSLSRRRFAASLATLVPEIRADDLVPTHAGVRAQAIERDGTLVDDFLLVRQGRQMHVLNAPSPAATSSLEIAKRIVAELPV